MNLGYVQVATFWSWCQVANSLGKLECGSHKSKTVCPPAKGVGEGKNLTTMTPKKKIEATDAEASLPGFYILRWNCLPSGGGLKMLSSAVRTACTRHQVQCPALIPHLPTGQLFLHLSMGPSGLWSLPIPSTYPVEIDHFTCGFLNGYFPHGEMGNNFPNLKQSGEIFEDWTITLQETCLVYDWSDVSKRHLRPPEFWAYHPLASSPPISPLSSEVGFSRFLPRSPNMGPRCYKCRWALAWGERNVEVATRGRAEGGLGRNLLDPSRGVIKWTLRQPRRGGLGSEPSAFGRVLGARSDVAPSIRWKPCSSPSARLTREKDV